ncbi:hypothetical protein TNCV_184691 [Trichonephila clavipes]|nr:hypothetical protein TNCV_184691 [Trichonephila clavipes]
MPICDASGMNGTYGLSGTGEYSEGSSTKAFFLEDEMRNHVFSPLDGIRSSSSRIDLITRIWYQQKTTCSPMLKFFTDDLLLK